MGEDGIFSLYNCAAGNLPNGLAAAQVLLSCPSCLRWLVSTY